MAITGGSAGGWTVLCALAFHPDVFAAGADYFGVSDLTGFVDDTHKFESRYNDWLVGPWPEAAELWRERSPINHADKHPRAGDRPPGPRGQGRPARRSRR